MNIFTIGYEGLDPDRFLAHLSCHGIDVVADVRKLPFSRKKGFSKTPLAKLLNDNHIDYLSFQELGAPREIRDALFQTGDYDRFFLNYQNAILDKTKHLQAIHDLIASGKKVALLCFERDPGQCHRKVVADQIKKLDGNGLAVKHIVPI